MKKCNVMYSSLYVLRIVMVFEILYNTSIVVPNINSVHLKNMHAIQTLRNESIAQEYFSGKCLTEFKKCNLEHVT